MAVTFLSFFSFCNQLLLSRVIISCNKIIKYILVRAVCSIVGSSMESITMSRGNMNMGRGEEQLTEANTPA